MQPSMEVRWFLTGKILKDIVQWFKRDYVSPLEDLLKEESRDDTYLSLPDSSAPKNCWKTVNKWRLTRAFEIIEGIKVTAFDASQFREEGCNIEMAKLTALQGQEWWSLGFEAFGPLEKVKKEPSIGADAGNCGPRFPRNESRTIECLPSLAGTDTEK